MKHEGFIANAIFIIASLYLLSQDFNLGLLFILLFMLINGDAIFKSKEQKEMIELQKKELESRKTNLDAGTRLMLTQEAVIRGTVRSLCK